MKGSPAYVNLLSTFDVTGLSTTYAAVASDTTTDGGKDGEYNGGELTGGPAFLLFIARPTFPKGQGG